MSENNVAAGSGVLLKAADTVATHRQQQKQIIQSVEAALAALRPRWKGVGGAAFGVAVNAWIADATRIVNALDTFESGLRGTNTNLESTEEEAAQAVRSMSVSSGYRGIAG